MKKRGQVTIFIIIAILIIVFIAFLFITKTEKKQIEQDLDYFKMHGIQPSIQNIQTFIIDCHEETSKQALKRIGFQGGYNNKPDYYYEMEWAFIPYYYYQGLQLMPNKQKIESELSSYLDDGIESCLNQINFPNFELEYQQPSTQTSISPESVAFNTNLLLSIDHKGTTTTFQLRQHPLTLKSSLNDIIEIADFITNSHTENPGLMCINCISELAEQKDLYVDFISLETDTTLVMILENRTMDEPYIFEFLNKYTIQLETTQPEI